jgi:plasmid stabilization system protein ParE
MAIELAGVTVQLADLAARIEAAETAAQAEGDRIRDLSTTIGNFADKGELANALRHRLIEAGKPRLAESPRALNERRAELEFERADLEHGIRQIAALLRPAPPVALPMVASRTPPQISPFEPIVMPLARVA